MPELPEVEVTLLGIAPHIEGKQIKNVELRQTKLRWAVDKRLPQLLRGQCVRSCSRRAKYLLIRFDTGILIIHLGMSGSLRIFRHAHPEAGKHDHIDWIFSDGTLMRYHDPRRFGAVLWYEGATEHHPLLADLGPEPLAAAFGGRYLYDCLQRQRRAVKTAIMDNAVVVGVGNIYANESLFQAAVRPDRPADSLTLDDCTRLAGAIRTILQRAIATGGSSLRDFVDSDGKSGYFQQEYRVYGRQGRACLRCGHPIVKTVLGQRGTYYCPNCQL